MTDALLLKSGLKMPSSFVEVKDDEMEYLEGGSLVVVGAIVGIIVGVVTIMGGCYGAGYAIGIDIRDTFNIHKVDWWLQLILHAAVALVGAAAGVGNALILGITNGIQS